MQLFVPCLELVRWCLLTLGHPRCPTGYRRPVPSRLPTVSRRAVLAGTGVAVAGLAGCSFDSLDPTDDDPTTGPTGGTSDSATAGTPSGPDDQPDDQPDDEALVAEVLSALALAHRTALGNRRAHRDLAGRLRRAEALHLAHAEELGDLPAATGQVTRAGETSAQALVRVDRAEAGLQRFLVAAAGAAGSGALAQTFASMAAGTAQLRTTLGAPGVDTDGGAGS